MFSHISPGSLILILLIVMMLFGTKRLREMGSDLGAAVRSFKDGMQGGDIDSNTKTTTQADSKR